MLKCLQMKWNLIYLEETTSTNDVATQLPLFSCVVAKKQTKGRGRCSRLWVSEEGNLFFSVVLKNYAEHSYFLSFIASLSVVESLENVSAYLKWPNDVLVDGKKVAGILLENCDDKIVVGVGINTAIKPNGSFLYPVGCLENKIENEDLLKRFLSNLKNNILLFEEKGFLPIREKWLRFAKGIGQSIKVNLPNESVEGVFIELTEGGAIRLKRDDGSCQLIVAGDVFLLDEGKRND